MARTRAAVRQPSDISIRLVSAYVFDWIIIIAFALISYGFNTASPNDRVFSLVNLDISYPIQHETISSTVLAIVSIVAPAVIILLVVLLVIPAPARLKTLSRGQIIRRKLWEWNSGWLGLGLSVTTTLLVVQGMKNVIGKPRPDMLARCLPDLGRIAAAAVGTPYGETVDPRWVLVDQSICTQSDQSLLDDGFRSFPSGHASTAFSGLLYLALYLCSKFAVVIPYLPSEAVTNTEPGNDTTTTPLPHLGSEDNAKRPMLTSLRNTPSSSAAATTRHRDEAAAPPVYLLILAYVPIGAALFISGTRYFNYRHHGFDIIVGALIGSVAAYLSFRFYHLPVARGSGWSWGPRSRSRAFGVGVGAHGWVDEEATHGRAAEVEAPRRVARRGDDLEMGNYGYEARGEASSMEGYADGRLGQSSRGGVSRGGNASGAGADV